MLGRSSLTLILGATAVAAGACRDDVTPPDTEDAVLSGGLGRLTSSNGDDRTPSWSQAGDSVYYSAEGFGHLPPAPGVLVGLPREGGPALEILKNAQLPNNLGILPWYVAPISAPDGSHVAFTEISSVWDPLDPCPGVPLQCDPSRQIANLTPLREIVVRVRRFDANGALDEDPNLSVAIAGTTEVQGPVFRTFTVFAYPFQQLFEKQRAFFFRSSWAPNGHALVFSDGLRLLVWDIETDGVNVIPNTEDGAWPSWSPDGEWIAFSRLERMDSTNVHCEQSFELGGCSQERVEYTVGARILTLVRPDGTGLRELGDGEEPAWAPDGRTIFFRHADLIWSIPRSGGQAARVPGTGGGREPAVSPDGRFLAFAKQGADGDYDIWVAELGR